VNDSPNFTDLGKEGVRQYLNNSNTSVGEGAAPDDYEVEGGDRPSKDNAQQEDDDYYDLEDEMIDMENVIQGESED
jgi:hypothetical protein